MIDFNQLINTAIAGHIHQMVQEQLQPLVDKLDEQAKVIGFLNAELANLKNIDGERITHYIDDYMSNHIEARFSEWVSDNDAEIMDSIEDRVDRRIESALEEFEFDMDCLSEELVRRLDMSDVADQVKNEIDFHTMMSDFIRDNVTVSIDPC